MVSLMAFAEMGPSAKAAVPAIQELVRHLGRIEKHLGRDLDGAAREALAKIDRDAAVEIQAQTK